MNIINDKEYIWAEKYRPKCIQDLIIPEKYKSRLYNFIERPSNLLLNSINPGTGKTSVVHALVNEGQFEAIFLNASLESGIDLLRSKVRQFASTQSFNNKPKIAVFDEADNLSESAQAAMRGFIEEFSGNCVFILTCNNITKIIPAIVNRFGVLNFDEIQSSLKEIAKPIIERLEFILNNEKIDFDKQDLVQVIKNYYPSIRGMINSLQNSITDNKLELNIQKSSDFLDIIELLNQKKYNDLLNKVYSLTNASGFYEFSYKSIQKYFENQKIPQVISILAKYQYQDPFVRDKNLNLMACLTEIMTLK